MADRSLLVSTNLKSLINHRKAYVSARGKRTRHKPRSESSRLPKWKKEVQAWSHDPAKAFASGDMPTGRFRRFRPSEHAKPAKPLSTAPPPRTASAHINAHAHTYAHMHLGARGRRLESVPEVRQIRANRVAGADVAHAWQPHQAHHHGQVDLEEEVLSDCGGCERRLHARRRARRRQRRRHSVGECTFSRSYNYSQDLEQTAEGTRGRAKHLGHPYCGLDGRNSSTGNTNGTGSDTKPTNNQLLHDTPGGDAGQPRLAADVLYHRGHIRREIRIPDPSTMDNEAALIVPASGSTDMSMPFTMLHDLRAYFDPLYRIYILKRKLRVRCTQQYESLEVGFRELFNSIASGDGDNLLATGMLSTASAGGLTAATTTGTSGASRGARAHSQARGATVTNATDTTGISRRAGRALANGEVDREALAVLVKGSGVVARVSEIDDLWDIIDEDRSGAISFDELWTWLRSDDDDWLGKRRSEADDTCNDRLLLMRESLKYDPEVTNAILEFWRLVDSDNSGSVSKVEYIDLSVHLQQAMAPEKFDVEAGRQVAMVEWEFDSQGFSFLDRSRFVLCFFQMADAWASEITSQAYSTFLRTLLNLTTAPDEEGNRTWLWTKYSEEKWVKKAKKRVAGKMGASARLHGTSSGNGFHRHGRGAGEDEAGPSGRNSKTSHRASSLDTGGTAQSRMEAQLAGASVRANQAQAQRLKALAAEKLKHNAFMSQLSALIAANTGRGGGAGAGDSPSGSHGRGELRSVGEISFSDTDSDEEEDDDNDSAHESDDDFDADGSTAVKSLRDLDSADPRNQLQLRNRGRSDRQSMVFISGDTARTMAETAEKFNNTIATETGTNTPVRRVIPKFGPDLAGAGGGGFWEPGVARPCASWSLELLDRREFVQARSAGPETVLLEDSPRGEVRLGSGHWQQEGPASPVSSWVDLEEARVRRKRMLEAGRRKGAARARVKGLGASFAGDGMLSKCGRKHRMKVLRQVRAQHTQEVSIVEKHIPARPALAAVPPKMLVCAESTWGPEGPEQALSPTLRRRPASTDGEASASASASARARARRTGQQPLHVRNGEKARAIGAGHRVTGQGQQRSASTRYSKGDRRHRRPHVQIQGRVQVPVGPRALVQHKRALRELTRAHSASAVGMKPPATFRV